jgi:hypothetical protein
MASKKLKQLQLGASEDGHLQLSGPVIENAIEDLTADITRPWVPSGEDFLLKIPDELLSEIIAFAITPPHYEWPRNYYGRALALTKVCQRLNRLVQPHLYHSIHFENSCSFVPPCLPTRRFYRTLKADPSLGRFCKELKIYVSDIPGVKSIHDYDLANELLCWLPNVTSFDLQGGFNGANGPALWAMVQRAVKHMPLIRHVSICREDVAGLLMTPIIEHLNLPLLKTLDIHGVSGVTNDGNDRQEHFGAQPVKVSSPQHRPSLHCYGQSLIRDLGL